jgi:hypothetical protein
MATAGTGRRDGARHSNFATSRYSGPAMDDGTVELSCSALLAEVEVVKMRKAGSSGCAKGQGRIAISCRNLTKPN